MKVLIEANSLDKVECIFFQYIDYKPLTNCLYCARWKNKEPQDLKFRKLVFVQ